MTRSDGNIMHGTADKTLESNQTVSLYKDMDLTEIRFPQRIQNLKQALRFRPRTRCCRNGAGLSGRSKKGC